MIIHSAIGVGFQTKHAVQFPAQLQKDRTIFFVEDAVKSGATIHYVVPGIGKFNRQWTGHDEPIPLNLIRDKTRPLSDPFLKQRKKTPLLNILKDGGLCTGFSLPAGNGEAVATPSPLSQGGWFPVYTGVPFSSTGRPIEIASWNETWLSF